MDDVQLADDLTDGMEGSERGVKGRENWDEPPYRVGRKRDKHLYDRGPTSDPERPVPRDRRQTHTRSQDVRRETR